MPLSRLRIHLPRGTLFIIHIRRKEIFMSERQSNKEQLKQITAGIEQGILELFQSDRYRNYLATMSRFHSYSLNNVMLIHNQNPNATHVAGRKRWQTQFSRHVLDDQRKNGINIIAPATFNKKISEVKLDPDTQLPMHDSSGKEIMEERTVKIPYFKVVQVFDVSQTDGKPLPQLAMNLTGDVAQFEIFLEALRRTSPVPIDITPMAGDTDGYLNLTTQRIALREGMSQVQTMSAAVHEVTHATLHNYEHMTELADDGVTILAPEEKDRNTEEVEAESVSYAVCQFFGIETGDNSFGYIASWSQGKDLKELKASLETINKTASQLITSIEHHFKEICQERGISLTAPEQEAEPLPLPDPPTITDPVVAYANEFATYVIEGSKGIQLPDIPSTTHEELAAWAEGHLRNSNFRVLTDALLDVVAISGQDARFDDLSDRIADMNLHGVPQQEAVPSPNTRPVYQLVSNHHRMDPEETTYIQKYLPSTDSRLIPAEIIYLGTHEECLDIQAQLRDGTMTEAQAKALDSQEKLYIISDSAYLHIQQTDNGFDYSLYDKATSKLIDGGQLDTPRAHIYSACLTICDLHGLDGYKVKYAPLELAASLQEAQYKPSRQELHDKLADHFSQEDAAAWQADTASAQPAQEQQLDTPQPDPYLTQPEMIVFGYTSPDMLPISTDFALELMERDVPVYMLYSNNTEAMAFDSEDLATHGGMIGITQEDWDAIRDQPDIIAIQSKFAVSYQRDLAAGAMKQPQRQQAENHLRAAEMSMEDDYGMIDGIINNGKAPGVEDGRKEKRPFVLEKLKAEPAAPKPKSTPKKSKEREI